MRYRSKLITAPLISPVEEGLFDEHMRGLGCQGNTVDLYLRAVVRFFVENVGIALITQTWESSVAGELEPNCQRFDLPIGPSQSIVSVKSFMRDVETVLDSAKYWLSKADDAVVFEQLPAVEYHGLNIRYVVGFGNSPDDVPEDLVQAVLMLGGHFYEHRLGEGTSVKYAVEVAETRLPPMVEQIIGRYRRWVA